MYNAMPYDTIRVACWCGKKGRKKKHPESCTHLQLVHSYRILPLYDRAVPSCYFGHTKPVLIQWHTLISASRKNKRFSGLASANPKGSKFLELGSGPSAPRRPPANSIDKEEDRAAVAGATARTAFGVTKALVEPTIARAEAANAVLMVLLSFAVC